LGEEADAGLTSLAFFLLCAPVENYSRTEALRIAAKS
jgi:hypothetical protein